MRTHSRAPRTCPAPPAQGESCRNQPTSWTSKNRQQHRSRQHRSRQHRSRQHHPFLVRSFHRRRSFPRRQRRPRSLRRQRPGHSPLLRQPLRPRVHPRELGRSSQRHSHRAPRHPRPAICSSPHSVTFSRARRARGFDIAAARTSSARRAQLRWLRGGSQLFKGAPVNSAPHRAELRPMTSAPAAPSLARSTQRRRPPCHFRFLRLWAASSAVLRY